MKVRHSQNSIFAAFDQVRSMLNATLNIPKEVNVKTYIVFTLFRDRIWFLVRIIFLGAKKLKHV